MNPVRYAVHRRDSHRALVMCVWMCGVLCAGITVILSLVVESSSSIQEYRYGRPYEKGCSAAGNGYALALAIGGYVVPTCGFIVGLVFVVVFGWMGRKRYCNTQIQREPASASPINSVTRSITNISPLIEEGRGTTESMDFQLKMDSSCENDCRTGANATEMVVVADVEVRSESARDEDNGNIGKQCKVEQGTIGMYHIDDRVNNTEDIVHDSRLNNVTSLEGNDTDRNELHGGDITIETVNVNMHCEETRLALNVLDECIESGSSKDNVNRDHNPETKDGVVSMKSTSNQNAEIDSSYEENLPPLPLPPPPPDVAEGIGSEEDGDIISKGTYSVVSVKIEKQDSLDSLSNLPVPEKLIEKIVEENESDEDRVQEEEEREVDEEVVNEENTDIREDDDERMEKEEFCLQDESKLSNSASSASSSSSSMSSSDSEDCNSPETKINEDSSNGVAIGVGSGEGSDEGSRAAQTGQSLGIGSRLKWRNAAAASGLRNMLKTRAFAQVQQDNGSNSSDSSSNSGSSSSDEDDDENKYEEKVEGVNTVTRMESIKERCEHIETEDALSGLEDGSEGDCIQGCNNNGYTPDSHGKSDAIMDKTTLHETSDCKQDNTVNGDENGDCRNGGHYKSSNGGEKGKPGRFRGILRQASVYSMSRNGSGKSSDDTASMNNQNVEDINNKSPSKRDRIANNAMSKSVTFSSEEEGPTSPGVISERRTLSPGAHYTNPYGTGTASSVLRYLTEPEGQLMALNSVDAGFVGKGKGICGCNESMAYFIAFVIYSAMTLPHLVVVVFGGGTKWEVFGEEKLIRVYAEQLHWLMLSTSIVMPAMLIMCIGELWNKG